MRLLLIEDDIDTLEFLKEKLVEKCFAVDTVTTCAAALAQIATIPYDVILVDYALPDQNGFTIIQTIRTLTDPIKKHTPIIMISVTHELTTKLEAFDYGADDYLPKPFLFPELFARIKNILKRPPLQEFQPIIIDDVIIDLEKQQVLKSGKPLNLTRKEFSLLEYLIKHEGSVVSRSAITEHVWDINIDPFSNTVDTHITNLRRKLESGMSRRIIKNIPGRGYIVELEK